MVDFRYRHYRNEPVLDHTWVSREDLDSHLETETIFELQSVGIVTQPCIVNLTQGELLHLSGYEIAGSELTPTGTYEVVEKVVNPYWKYDKEDRPEWNGLVHVPGPHNPIGDLLIILAEIGGPKINYSIHKWPTHAPTEFAAGIQEGTGCLRMREEDLRAFFAQVRLGTTVIIER